MMRDKLILNRSNQILYNHKIGDEFILPGVAYIDIIHQLFRENNYDFRSLCITNLLIHQPVVGRSHPALEITIVCVESTPSSWAITIQDASAIKHIYASAIVSIKNQPLSKIPYHTTSTHVPKMSQDLGDMYDVLKKLGLNHTGFLKAHGDISTTELEIIINVRGCGAIKPSPLDFMFNPATLDASAACMLAKQQMELKCDHELYLPIGFESFYAKELIQNQCTATVQRRLVSDKKDIITFTIAFFNSSSIQIAELKNLACKRVTTKQNTQQNTLRYEPNGNRPWENFLKQKISPILSKPQHQISDSTTFAEMGMDSKTIMQLTRILNDELHVEFPPSMLFEYNSITELALHLSGLMKTDTAGGTQIEGAHIVEKVQQSSNNNQSTSYTKTSIRSTDVAIVSMACRYPGALTVQQFLDNLALAKDAIIRVPPDRWDHDSIAKFVKPFEKDVCKFGGFLDDVDKFDAAFFNISPDEADAMDPMQRIFLETVWTLFESRGYTRRILKSNFLGKVGVFVGAMYQHYQLFSHETYDSRSTIHSHSSIANRVSQFFDLNGPSVALDTMCSSSLSALHLAYESLIRGECRMAVVGGINLSIHPKKYLGLSELELSGSGDSSRAFSTGDGYIPSEGAGAILIKPLTDAISDSDDIIAVINSIAISHSGKGNGFGAPCPKAQKKLINDHLLKAGISSRDIQYIEVSAAGSEFADGIELQALTEIFTNENGSTHCVLGSVKTLIGHSEAASGIAQIIKVAGQLKFKKLFPNLLDGPLNEVIRREAFPFKIQEKLQEWACENSRRAAINSFPLGGSNAHVLMQESPLQEVLGRKGEDTLELITLSARDWLDLLSIAQRFLDYVSNLKSSISHIAYTLQERREEMEYRLAIVANTADEISSVLHQFINSKGDKTKEPYVVPIIWSGINRWLGFRNCTSESGVEGKLIETHLENGLRWINGSEIDWKKYRSGFHEVVELPTYPFKRNRHWLEKKEQAKDVPIPDTLSSNVDSIGSYISNFIIQELKINTTQVLPNVRLQKFGCTSLVLLKLLRRIELKYHVKLTIKETSQKGTIDDLAQLVSSKIIRERNNSEGILNSTNHELQSSSLSKTTDLEKFRLGLLDMQQIMEIVKTW